MSKFKEKHKKKEKTHKEIKRERGILSIKAQEYEELKEKAKLADERLEILMRTQIGRASCRERV